MAALVAGEWIYLAMNGRFPRRVEEIIWLLTFCTAVLLVGQILLWWKDVKWLRLPGLVQILLLTLFLQHNPVPASLEALQSQQLEALANQSRKVQVLEYCGEHPDNYYVLRKLTGREPGEAVNAEAADYFTIDDGSEYYVYKVY